MAITDGVPALASLAMTFGGFSPTAMDGVEATRKQIDKLNAETARRKQAERRRRDLLLAKTSAPKTWDDGAGTQWSYVVVDERLVRLRSCKTKAEQLVIPESIDNLPVYALGPDSCSRLEEVHSIVCPSTIEEIGGSAFRQCPQLRDIVLPANVDEFHASWLQECTQLERMVLPGLLGELKAEVFEFPLLRHLTIGASLHTVDPGAFRNSKLETLTVDSSNPYLKTDGDALYSVDGSVFIALARPVQSYDVAEGCRAIGRKAFDGREETLRVSVPDTLVTLAPFAFTHAGLTSFTTPPALTEIGEKAFYYCRNLTKVSLNEGLERIGDSAFEESALEALHIPASIQHIGRSITLRTNVVHRGPGCTLQIADDSPSLFLDGNGGLYRREEDGIHLIQLIDREAHDYTALAGVAVIDEHACSHHDCIQRVTVPEGAVRVCKNAFRHSTALTHVQLPDTIQEIGDDAFLDTKLESFNVPASCTHIGANALITANAHHGDGVPSLHEVSVSAGNERFYVERGMLCRRDADGDHVVVFTSSEPQVIFPPSIVHVETYAFNNARGIQLLSLNKNLKTISSSGLTTWCWIDHIHVELEEPLEGRTTFDFNFPRTAKAKHAISMAVGGASWVHVPGMFAQYDICVINAHDYNSPGNPDYISSYEQVRRVMARLADPICLTEVNRGMYDRLLRNYIIQICVDIARHDDRILMNQLVDTGYVNNDNLEDIIVAVGNLQDAAMTGYLLELKRRCFGHTAIDFDL